MFAGCIPFFNPIRCRPARAKKLNQDELTRIEDWIQKIARILIPIKKATSWWLF